MIAAFIVQEKVVIVLIVLTLSLLNFIVVWLQVLFSVFATVSVGEHQWNTTNTAFRKFFCVIQQGPIG